MKITHECPFANISRKFPSLKMFSWCNGEHDIYELIVDKPEAYKEVLREISKLGGIVEESSDQHKVHLVTRTCTCNKENSVNKNIEDFDLLHVSPIVYSQGWEYYRVIAFKHEAVKRLMQRLEDRGFVFEILRKIPFNGFIASSLTLTADALFSHLTEKQMDALLIAYNNGYYRFPRKADIQTIAAKRRVPRTTFQEHLKKAENKIVTSLVPYAQLYKRASPEARKSLKVK
ncbi:helix-turn-helix domain-containing protein [Candidatus Bathyarchaeota archaeon]|nr:helix-turn-helix domain-containing protein [Candidatus Bathyarchaeota archaeon]